MTKLAKPLAVLTVALAASAAVLAQPTPALQRFPLNKAIQEPALTVCKSPEVLIKLNTLMADGNEAEATKTFEHALIEGQCINAAGVVVYTRQVHRVDAVDGSVWTVYEASAGRAKFYVPMLGFLHEELSA